MFKTLPFLYWNSSGSQCLCSVLCSTMGTADWWVLVVSDFAGQLCMIPSSPSFPALSSSKFSSCFWAKRGSIQFWGWNSLPTSCDHAELIRMGTKKWHFHMLPNFMLLSIFRCTLTNPSTFSSPHVSPDCGMDRHRSEQWQAIASVVQMFAWVFGTLSAQL